MVKSKNILVKAIIVALTAVIAVLSVAAPAICYAGDDNFGFAFTVKENEAPSGSEDTRDRTTQKTDNAWKVNFKTSDEPIASTKTGTLFYLGITTTSPYSVGSKKQLIKEGSGPKYYSAYKTASPGKVMLYAQDNDDGTKGSYHITGTWDEETTKDPVND